MSHDLEPGKTKARTATHFFFRGLAISLPTVLTIVILLWIVGGINTYLIRPTSDAVTFVLAQFLDDSIPANNGNLVDLTRVRPPELDYAGRNYLVTRELQRRWLEEYVARAAAIPSAETSPAPAGDPEAVVEGTATGTQLTLTIDAETWLMQPGNLEDIYVRLGQDAVPYDDFVVVAREIAPYGELPTTSTRLYMEYAKREYFKSAFLLSAFALAIVIVALYFLGRIVSVRLGGWMVQKVERNVLGRLPVIRNVYGSTKQVTDFLFSEQQVEYRRVVAIEYPRRGIWSLGLVTGESMLDIAAAVGEPCLSVLIPSSPMPVTGYTMSVPRSEVMDLNITVDQVLQFCVSCGVLIPPHQKVTPELLQQHLTRRLTEGFRMGGTQRMREDDDRRRHFPPGDNVSPPNDAPPPGDVRSMKPPE